MAPEVEVIHLSVMSEKNLLYRFTNNGLDLKVVEDALELIGGRCGGTGHHGYDDAGSERFLTRSKLTLDLVIKLPRLL